MKISKLRWTGAPLMFGCLTVMVSPARADSPVTFFRDVLPVLQKHCQSCHRPGNIAPMSFLDYEQARPWAKAIRAAVLQKKMPPWPADPEYGDFSNNPSLSEREIAVLTGWSDGGARRGDAAVAPEPLQFEDGWTIGTPDVVIEMPREFRLPASAEIPYQHLVIPSGFTEDKWVQSVEIRPGNRAVVHHAIAMALYPESKAFQGAKDGEFIESPRRPFDPDSAVHPAMFASGIGTEGLQVYLPGGRPPELQPGQARMVKAGSRILLTMHYTTTGRPETDRTSLGIVFAKRPPSERIKMVNVANNAFTIPPGVENHKIDARARLKRDVTLFSFTPHMHVRGKSFEYRVRYPNGESEILLRVSRWDFDWQLTYYLKTPKLLPRGTILEVEGRYDNSTNNPYNPDPSAVVYYGPQTWNEMLGGMMEVSLDPEMGAPVLFEAATLPTDSGAPEN